MNMLITFVVCYKMNVSPTVECFTDKEEAFKRYDTLTGLKLRVVVLVNGKPKHTESKPPVTDEEYMLHKQIAQPDYRT